MAHKEFLAQLDTLGAVPIHGSTAESVTRDIGQEVAFWNKWAKDVGAPLAKKSACHSDN